MAAFAEEVGVAGIGQLNGHAGAVVVGQHLQLEVVGLRATSSKLSVDMELALPLASTHALGQRNLIGVAIVGGHGLSSKCRPAVVGKPVTEGIELRTVVDSAPQVVGIVVVQNDSLFEVDLTDLDMRSGR